MWNIMLAMINITQMIKPKEITMTSELSDLSSLDEICPMTEKRKNNDFPFDLDICCPISFFRPYGLISCYTVFVRNITNTFDWMFYFCVFENINTNNFVSVCKFNVTQTD